MDFDFLAYLDKFGIVRYVIGATYELSGANSLIEIAPVTKGKGE